MMESGSVADGNTGMAEQRQQYSTSLLSWIENRYTLYVDIFARNRCLGRGTPNRWLISTHYRVQTRFTPDSAL